MASIRYFPATHPLPDWRNFGVMLRVLLGVNIMALAAALVQSPGLAEWGARYVEMAALVQPLLLLALGLLAGVRNPLRALPLRLGQICVVALVGGLAYGQQLFWQSLGFGDVVNPWRPVILAVAASIVLLGYFELRARAFSPAQTEARLAALNARIRPHFPVLQKWKGIGETDRYEPVLMIERFFAIQFHQSRMSRTFADRSARPKGF